MGRFDSSVDQSTNQILLSIQDSIITSGNINKPKISFPPPRQGMSFFGDGYFSAFMTPGSYNFIVPYGVTAIRVRAIGGGGGGAGYSASSGGGVHAQGGGGGAFAMKVFSGLTPGQVLPFSVGAGGYGGYTGVAPTAGGSSVFNSILTAGGGREGKFINANLPQSSSGTGIGGTASGGDVNYSGGNAGSVPPAGSIYYNNNVMATGGGASGSIMGNGYSGGNGFDAISYVSFFATGGGGVGGNGLSSNSQSSGMLSSPGGGSMGGAFMRKEITAYKTSPGGGQFTYIQEQSNTESGVLPYSRFTGEFLIGIGGLSKTKTDTTITDEMLHGGSGAGGGGNHSYESGSTVIAIKGGNGGVFGGGGGACTTSCPAGSSAIGGFGLLGGGGGGASMGGAVGVCTVMGGPGGNGMVIIEW